MNNIKTVLIILCAGMALAAYASDTPRATLGIAASWDIAEVLSDFPVDFCLLTHGQHQYVAYYDAQRRMTVAARTVDSDAWQYQVLPTTVGWDSHNYVTMAVDDEGYIHLSGNMHCEPLVYFRTSKPGDITTFERIVAMTGLNEKRCTYPVFMRSVDNRLIFHYRETNPGVDYGIRIYNVYDLKTRTWQRLLDAPLTDGQGKMDTYIEGPLRGPDGWFHIAWVWRHARDCAANSHLSYARSKDLLHWESAAGVEVKLPITLGQSSLWVDPIPSGGGIINGCQKLAFDSVCRPIVSYHKADTNGNMQIYATRFEDGQWVQHVLTDWSKPVKFGGAGTMGFIGISIDCLTKIEPGLFYMTYTHRDYGNGLLVIDEKTLQPSDKKITIPNEYPNEVNQVRMDFEGIGIRGANDIGNSGKDEVRYVLRWETLGSNFDRPRQPPLPNPSMLRIIKLSPP